MAQPKHRKHDRVESDRISTDRIRMVGAMEPYAGADPLAVEQRLRNMNYGSTNNRVTKIRHGEVDPGPVTAVG